MNGKTIAAICTAPGRAGIAVVRVSGADAFRIADALCPGAAEMEAGTFRLRKIRDPRSGGIIDEAVVLAFRAPRSYTGEDVVEFQTHGGATSASAVLAAALSFGAAPAGPGEFTKRAFLNGRVDLSAAEAVMDLIGAESDRAARAAAEQLSGALGRRVDSLLDSLLAVCADIEASLDFADDEANSVLEPAGIPERLAALLAEIRALCDTWREGRLLREGALVVLSGAPNAGKSTLFNTLLGACRAIVTDIPGTTRDSIEEPLVLDGIPLRLVDTAGIRAADSEIERLGVQRSEALISKADLNLRVIDITEQDAEPLPPPTSDPNTILVLNKSDLSPDPILPCHRPTPTAAIHQVSVSAATGAGIGTLKTAIKAALLGGSPAHGVQSSVAVSARHHKLLSAAAVEIETALASWRAGAADSAVLCAQPLRAAAESLGQITGRTYTDALLEKIFSSFCIGK